MLLTSYKLSGPILMISGHMDVSWILGWELLATDLTIVKETAWKMHTFNVIQHIWPQSIFGTTNCALVLVLFILLEVLCQDLPGLKSWEIVIFKCSTPSVWAFMRLWAFIVKKRLSRIKTNKMYFKSTPKVFDLLHTIMMASYLTRFKLPGSF